VNVLSMPSWRFPLSMNIIFTFLYYNYIVIKGITCVRSNRTSVRGLVSFY
jgi:hypothetical protein